VGTQRNRKLILLTGTLLLFLLSAEPILVGAFLGGFPSILTPAPLLLVFPIFRLGAVSPAAAPIAFVIPATLFYLWCKSLRDPYRKGWSEEIVLALVVGGSFAWFIPDWRLGLRYEGRTYMVGMATMNTLLAISIAALILATRWRQSVILAIITRFFMIAWLATYAFPWIGETP
jgi:hypothetical protein